MIIENRLETSKVRIIFLIVLFLPIALLIYIFTSDYPTDHIGLMIFIVALLVAYVIMHVLMLYYVYFSDRGGKITVRYYYAHPFLRKYKAIEIPKGMLVDAVISSSFFGLKHSLELVQRTKKGNYSYPKISLSMFNKKKRAQIQSVLANELKASRTGGMRR